MKLLSSVLARHERALLEPISPAAAWHEQLFRTFRAVEQSRHVFASPFGPLRGSAGSAHLQRFVYFGPGATDAALRLSFLGGLDHRELRGSLALLRFIEGLALAPDLGQGLDLSFFPLVDALGLAEATPARDLAEENWATSTEPEIQVLEHDARLRGYHGFVRLETTTSDEVTVRLHAEAATENAAPPLELISSDEIEPLPVRWEVEADADPRRGPLAVADDLPVAPFELVLAIPALWPAARHTAAVSLFLKRFVRRHRGFIAYAQHL
ncbi:M14 family metallocarboxypeptidase [Opitutus sp. ER46]|uniref:M14 family metallocarboxypeptidase n=1 Tax=Opitutus sp. ER46 TaxID=2161864 RepID=UPI0011B1D318|nr:M14 family metallocarboxypeptidase [Opitutus sp. ER46]